MPVVEREVVVQEPAARETVVVQQPVGETVVESGSRGASMVLGIVAVILIALAVVWFLGGAFGGGGDAVSVDLPNVTVQN